MSRRADEPTSPLTPNQKIRPAPDVLDVRLAEGGGWPEAETVYGPGSASPARGPHVSGRPRRPRDGRSPSYCGWSASLLAFTAGASIALVTAPVGVSGAVFLLPVQLSVLGVPSPAVTPTNLLYNVVAGPGALLLPLGLG